MTIRKFCSRRIFIGGQGRWDELELGVAFVVSGEVEPAAPAGEGLHEKRGGAGVFAGFAAGELAFEFPSQLMLRIPSGLFGGAEDLGGVEAAGGGGGQGDGGGGGNRQAEEGGSQPGALGYEYDGGRYRAAGGAAGQFA